MQIANYEPSQRRRGSNSNCCDRRAGFCATGEVLLILGIVAALILGLNLALTSLSGTPMDARKVSDRLIYDILVDDDEQSLWINEFSKDIICLDATTGEVKMTLPTQDIAVSAMAHNRDGSLSLVCAADGSATLFRNGEKAQRVVLAGTDHFEAAVYDNCAVALVASGGQVHGVSWHGTAMRKFSHDNTVRSDVLKFGLSSTLRRMYVARRNGYVSFQDLETDESAGATLNVGQNSIAFSWSQDERLFGVLYDDLAIRVYDVQMGRILKSGTLGTPFQPVTFAIMRMSPDQRQMAVSNSQSMTIDIWDITTGATVGKLTGHTAHMHTLQFSADSDRLFSGGYDGTIREWSLKTYSQLRLIN